MSHSTKKVLPTALQVVKDAQLEGQLDGKVAVITGVSSGIGVETVRALAATGLSLILLSRSFEKTKSALGASFNPEKMELVYLEQTSLESVRDAAKTILAKTDKINILIANAGILMVPERQLSKDGFELQFATNHVSHFLLFQLLKPALLAASTPEFQSRVVVVSSDAHRAYALNDTGNYNFEKGGYVPYLAYAQSKSANVYMANEIERRYGSQGIHGLSLHPGAIETGLSRYMTEQQVNFVRASTSIWRSTEQGAATTVWGAISKELEGKGGKYLTNCSVSTLLPGTTAEDPDGVHHGQNTYHPEYEARLWKDSLEMIGMQDDN